MGVFNWMELQLAQIIMVGVFRKLGCHKKFPVLGFVNDDLVDIEKK